VGCAGEKGGAERHEDSEERMREPPRSEAPSWVFLLTGIVMGAAAGYLYCKSGIAVRWIVRGR
jgi:hypothetical protein